MAVHTFTVPRYLPPSVNRLLAINHRGRKRLKDECAGFVRLYAHQAGVPPAAGRRRVDLLLTLAGRGRPPDPDNILKSLLDGLVRAGLLRDDGPGQCELGTVSYSRGPSRATTVTLTDCD